MEDAPGKSYILDIIGLNRSIDIPAVMSCNCLEPMEYFPTIQSTSIINDIRSGSCL